MFATFGTGVNRLSGEFFTDLSIGYTLPWKAKILAGANNLFDKKPRIVYTASSTYGGTSSSSSLTLLHPTRCASIDSRICLSGSVRRAGVNCRKTSSC